MKMLPAPVHRGLAVGILLVGLVLLFARLSVWPWARIGGLLGLVGLLIMLTQEKLQEYGDDHASFEQANAGGRPAARALARAAYAIGIPLVILSAIFQVIGNPADSWIIRAVRSPKHMTYTLENGKQFVDPARLDTEVTALNDGLGRVDSVLATIHDRALLIRNCGRATTCNCPATYQRVPDSGRWDLNAGTRGDHITLCERGRKVRDGAP